MLDVVVANETVGGACMIFTPDTTENVKDGFTNCKGERDVTVGNPTTLS
jgi:hypothetical protein